MSPQLRTLNLNVRYFDPILAIEFSEQDINIIDQWQRLIDLVFNISHTEEWANLWTDKERQREMNENNLRLRG